MHRKNATAKIDPLCNLNPDLIPNLKSWFFISHHPFEKKFFLIVSQVNSGLAIPEIDLTVSQFIGCLYENRYNSIYAFI